MVVCAIGAEQLADLATKLHPHARLLELWKLWGTWPEIASKWLEVVF